MASNIGGSKGGPKISKLKDTMDGLLEPRGYYRRHLPRTLNSIFNAASDVLFGTHAYWEEVKRSHDLTKVGDPDLSREAEEHEHPEAFVVTQIFGFRTEIIKLEADSMRRTGVPYLGRLSTRERKPLRLCFTPPAQYDPIYTMDRYDGLAFCQSILYKLLYEAVFEIYDASEAAEKMIAWPVDVPKPENYEKEYDHSAVEVLERNKIPFPYKVAKTLDPGVYRNIEHDCWVRNNKIRSGSAFSESPNQRQKQRKRVTIGTLNRASPLLLEDLGMGDVFGLFVGLSDDRRLVEAYVPPFRTFVRVPRKSVKPLQSTPTEYLEDQRLIEEGKLDPSWYPVQEECSQTGPLEGVLEHCPEPERVDPEDEYVDIRGTQQRNMFLVASDPDWEEKFDCSVPPPPPPIVINHDVQLQTQLSSAVIVAPSPTTPATPLLVVPVPYSILNPVLNPDGSPVFAYPPIPTPLPSPTPSTPNGPNIFQFPSPMSTPVAICQGSIFDFPDFLLPGNH